MEKVAVINKGGNGVQAPAGVATAPATAKAGKAKVQLAAVTTLSPAEQAAVTAYVAGKGGTANGVTPISRWLQVEYTASGETKKGWVRLP